MKRNTPRDLLWLAALLAVTAILVIPATRQGFIHLTTGHPYLMGFAKFALLATMGELLAIRLAVGAWQQPRGLFWRVLVWGLVGVAITFMFGFYAAGVSALVESGTLPAGSGVMGKFLTAFYTSAIMNLTFGPVFMAAHRISDTYIDLRSSGKNPSWGALNNSIRWGDFITFVVGKTIPFWWIPAHTLTFLLPVVYRVVAAAYLSIVLGVILIYARKRN